MTGRELIDWIHEHNAEDCECVIHYGDSGGDYPGGETVWPDLVSGKPYEVLHFQGKEIKRYSSFDLLSKNPNIILL